MPADDVRRVVKCSVLPFNLEFQMLCRSSLVSVVCVCERESVCVRESVCAVGCVVLVERERV